MVLNQYEVHFMSGIKIMFLTVDDLSKIIEKDILKNLWDYNREKFIVLKNIAFVNNFGTIEIKDGEV